jgi:hypothetical protein
MCDHESGMFITKVDVFFHSKDDTLPVWFQVISGVQSGATSIPVVTDQTPFIGATG